MSVSISKTGYVVTIPMKVDSASEAETSAGEERSAAFPSHYFQAPLKHFRIFPASTKAAGDSDDEEGASATKSRTARRGQVSSRDAALPRGEKAASSAVLRALDKAQALLRQFTDEGFGKTQRAANEEQKERLRVVLGLNKMRSISRSRNASLGHAASEIGKDTAKPSVVAFFWEGVYQERSSASNKWKECSFERVRTFYRQLKKVSSTAAHEFQNKLEGKRGHIVPYRGLRERLAQSSQMKQMVRELRQNPEIGKVFMGMFDDDSLSLRAKDGFGVFTHYDRMVQENPDLEMGSCGYIFTGQKSSSQKIDPVMQVTSEFDLRIRHVTAKHLAYGVYLPEPSCIIVIDDDRETIRYSFETSDRHYSSPQESIIILEQIKQRFQADPKRVAFDRRGAIPSATPARAEKPFQAHYNAYKMIVRWTLRDIKRMRGVAQSHLHPKKWADNVIRALRIREVSFEVDGAAFVPPERTARNMAASLITRFFNHYNVISMAEEQFLELQAEKIQSAFPSELIKILDSYKPSSMSVKPVIRKKLSVETPQSKAWKQQDLIQTLQGLRRMLTRFVGPEDAKRVEKAAIDCGKEVLEVFRKNFETHFDELSLALMRDYLKELNPDEKAAIDSLIPLPSAQIILNNEVFSVEEKVRAAFTGTLRSESAASNPLAVAPLHWAAITGNHLLAHALKQLQGTLAPMGRIDAVTKGGATPLHCALKYCADNANDLRLIRELLDAKTATMATDDGRLPLILALEELENPAPVVELLLQFDQLPPEHKEPLLQVLEKLHPVQCRTSLLNSLIIYMPDDDLPLITELVKMGLHVGSTACAIRDEDIAELEPELPDWNMEAFDHFYSAAAVPLAVRRGNVALVQALIEHGAKVNGVFDDEGNSVIHAAVKYLEEPEAMLQMLSKHGAMVLEFNQNNDPPPLRYLLEQYPINWDLFDCLLDMAEEEEDFASFFFETGAHGYGGLVEHVMSHDPDLTRRLAEENTDNSDLDKGTRGILRALCGKTSDAYESSSGDSDSASAVDDEASFEEYTSDVSVADDASSERSQEDDDVELSPSESEQEPSSSLEGSTPE